MARKGIVGRVMRLFFLLLVVAACAVGYLWMRTQQFADQPIEFAGGEKVMEIANAPGEPILPGQLAKALEIIASGGDVDYVGASAVELIAPGEAAGVYREVEVDGGVLKTIGYR